MGGPHFGRCVCAIRCDSIGVYTSSVNLRALCWASYGDTDIRSLGNSNKAFSIGTAKVRVCVAGHTYQWEPD